MRAGWSVVLVWGLVAISGMASADEVEDLTSGPRVDSRYCTVWLDPVVTIKDVNRRVNTWLVRGRGGPRGATDSMPENQLAAKCDLLFRRAQELLDMYPPGVHVTIKIARQHAQITDVHAAHYGRGTEAVAFYLFENNTIYATVSDVSESVLVHEMAHCIMDHYFRVRPPRKIEELLAMYVDTNLRD